MIASTTHSFRAHRDRTRGGATGARSLAAVSALLGPAGLAAQPAAAPALSVAAK